MTTDEPKETYIGDGVYASFDGYQIKLRTDRGNFAMDEIFLEPEFFVSLLRFARTFWTFMDDPK
jgi:hypothetical protein